MEYGRLTHRSLVTLNQVLSGEGAGLAQEVESAGGTGCPLIAGLEVYSSGPLPAKVSMGKTLK